MISSETHGSSRDCIFIRISCRSSGDLEFSPKIMLHLSKKSIFAHIMPVNPCIESFHKGLTEKDNVGIGYLFNVLSVDFDGVEPLFVETRGGCQWIWTFTVVSTVDAPAVYFSNV